MADVLSQLAELTRGKLDMRSGALDRLLGLTARRPS
jgi:hypothetical protein